MKSTLLAGFVAASAVCLASSFAAAQEAKRGPVVLVTKFSPVEFAFPAGWYVNPEKHPFDLHCFSAEKETVTGIFVFKKEDLAATTKPADIFERQIEDLKGKRDNFQIYEPRATSRRGELIFTKVTYTGDKDLARNCYRFTLIEFKSDPSRFAIALQIGFPSDWKNAKAIFDEIADSAKPLKEMR